MTVAISTVWGDHTSLVVALALAAQLPDVGQTGRCRDFCTFEPTSRIPFGQGTRFTSSLRMKPKRPDIWGVEDAAARISLAEVT